GVPAGYTYSLPWIVTLISIPSFLSAYISDHLERLPYGRCTDFQGRQLPFQKFSHIFYINMLDSIMARVDDRHAAVRHIDSRMVIDVSADQHIHASFQGRAGHALARAR